MDSRRYFCQELPQYTQFTKEWMTWTKLQTSWWRNRRKAYYCSLARCICLQKQSSTDTLPILLNNYRIPSQLRLDDIEYLFIQQSYLIELIKHEPYVLRGKNNLSFFLYWLPQAKYFWLGDSKYLKSVWHVANRANRFIIRHLSLFLWKLWIQDSRTDEISDGQS